MTTATADRELTVRCTYINKTKGHVFGEDPEPQVAFTSNRGRLFLELQREYGRCTGTTYTDLVGGKSVVTGYTFEKKMEYEGYRSWHRGDRFYIREVWVEIGTVEPEPEEDDEPDDELLACIESGEHLAKSDQNGYCVLCNWRD